VRGYLKKEKFSLALGFRGAGRIQPNRAIRRLPVVVAVLAAGCWLAFAGEQTRWEEHRKKIAQLDFDAIERKRDDKFQQYRLLDIGGVKPGMVVGEIGAGEGYLTFHLAARVGPTGKVYANDIVEDMALEIIRRRAKEKGLANIETILGADDDPRFPKDSLDLVFFLNSFHEVRKQVELLGNLVPSLKPGAKVIIHEWEAEKPMDVGPTGDRNYTRQELLDIIARSPFKVETIDTSFPGPRSAAFVLTVKDQASSQPASAAILKELNGMLLNFCYNKPQLELAGGGKIFRKDSDGTLWRFDFHEISDIVINLEGEAHGGIIDGCRAHLALIPSQGLAAAVLINGENVRSIEICDRIFAALLPAYERQWKAASPPGAGPPQTPAFKPPAGLVGIWEGIIHTHEGDVRVRFTAEQGGGMRIARGDAPGVWGESLAPLKTPVMNRGVCVVHFPQFFALSDAPAAGHRTVLGLTIRKDRLSGEASLIASDGSYSLPSFIALDRVKSGDAQ
jgi:ubiquinone/menaquinone biosynthesis C-methylase UbiE